MTSKYRGFTGFEKGHGFKKPANDLKNFAGEFVTERPFIRACFGGMQGSGKSYTAALLAIGIYKDMALKNPVLVIDNENGMRFHEHAFKKENISVLLKETTAYGDFIEAMNYLQYDKISILFIDSMTRVWYRYIDDYMLKNGLSVMSRPHWMHVIHHWNRDVNYYLSAIKGNVIFTGRGGFTYSIEEIEEDDRKKQIMTATGVKMKMASETPFEPDLSVWMDAREKLDPLTNKIIRRYHEAIILKDRTNNIDGDIIINPKYSDFRKSVQATIGLSVGKRKMESDSENYAIIANQEYNAEAAIEEITGCFNVMSFGLSKEDKQIKAYVSETIFGTTSITKMKLMPYKELSNGVERLKTFKKRYLELFEKAGEITFDQIKGMLK